MVKSAIGLEASFAPPQECHAVSCVRCERLGALQRTRWPLTHSRRVSRQWLSAAGTKRRTSVRDRCPGSDGSTSPIHVTVGHLIEVALAKRWGCCPPLHGEKNRLDLPPIGLWDGELDG